MKKYNWFIRFLLWVGFVRVHTGYGSVSESAKNKGTIVWPFHVPPKHIFMVHFKHGGTFPRFYVFRNLPGVIKWEKGRLLPRRWGFGICGFEFGDRG